jgi:predicted phage gp36 major capsid-like protein
MKAWIIKYWRKFLWLFASAEAKKAKADAEIKATMDRVHKESITQEQSKRLKEFNDYVQSLIEEGKKRGMDDAQAKKWAWKKIEEKIEKDKRSGQLIGCTICHQRGVNHTTGGMIRNPDGTYRHQNCGG